MIFCSREDNDLYRVIRNSGLPCPCVNDLSEAIKTADSGDSLLVLADDYPAVSYGIKDEVLQIMQKKHLRVYLEYPLEIPGYEIGEPRSTEWERVVTASDFFAPELPSLSILALHGCWYLPMKADSPLMVVARVAGYHRAVYGLPEERSPILFKIPDHEILVATSKLSQFVTGRYGPKNAWQIIWERLLSWLKPSTAELNLKWEPTVDIQAQSDEELPSTAEQSAFKKSVRWFREEAVFSTDQKKGVIEGFESAIDCQGRQKRRVWVRGDCTGEASLVFAYDWAIHGNPDSRQLTTQILDYVWSPPDFRQDNPDSPVYGLNNWYERGPVFYGDDNARVILPTLAASRLLKEDRWDVFVLRCLLANLRTTGPLGFRMARLDYPASFPEGMSWTHYRDTEVIHYAPHYQAYLWAAFLWAYALTGYEGFLGKTKTAIRMTMEAYPKWQWTNGIMQERARMLLPLAFLIRLEDTKEHRAWLNLLAEDLLALMQPCGALREEMGDPGTGQYPSPQSNAAYGTNEASLIQENGDPACDLLYTTNYAFLGLHEAVAATGDKRLRCAEDQLADFLCRIQVRSSVHPYLDGAWMRSFDYERWEYWGSSADSGWGAWCVESGWTNAWIASVLAMRQRGDSLFDASLSNRVKARFPAILKEMMDERSIQLSDKQSAPLGSRPGSE